MKTTIVIIVFLAASLAGCKKFLEEDPKGLLVGDFAVSTVEGLNAQLAGAYSTLIGDWGTGFASAGPMAVCMGGDDITTHPGLNKQDFREFDQFNVSALNGRMLTIWNGMYKSIQSANNIIENAPKVKGDAAAIDQIVGEAYFVRGFSYFYLVKCWGKIPLLTSAKYSDSLKTISPSDIADVYQQVESDLQQAENLVGDTRLAPGRPNKGTVKAVLADVYLTEGGWPMKDESKYALAATKAKEIMDNKATWGFDLYQGGYDDIFYGTTSENVWTLFTDNNVSSNHFYGMSGIPGDAGGWDDYCAEINFFNDFPDGPRKDAYFTTSVTVDGNTIQWEDFAIHHPYYRKFQIQHVENPIDYNSASPIQLMRYAEVLLIYAEASARTGTPTTEAYDAINAVRSRAGLPALSGLSAADFIKAVLDERKWEFAAELHRWFDIVRTETVGEANSHRNAGEIKLLGDPNDKKNWLLPIPGTEAAINPNLNN